MARSVVFITTAEMGTGKTYCRGPVFVSREWLPYHSGLHISNLPLHADKIAAHVRRRNGGNDFDAERRIRRIPEDVFQKWIEPGSLEGPWSFLGTEEWPLAGSHIAIDEAHLCAPRVKEVERRRLWNKWLAEIRHAGATVEFITQDITRLDEELRRVVGLRVSLVAGLTDRDPLFKIPMADWYELKSCITREWNPCVTEIEKRRVDGKWEVTRQKKIELNSTYYALYDSFSKPHAFQTEGKETKDVKEQHEFERRSIPGVVWWFIKRNWGGLGKVVGLTLVCLWLFWGGGLVWAMLKFTELMPRPEGAAVEAAAENGGDVGNAAAPGAIQPAENLPSGEFDEFGLARGWSFDDVLYRYERPDGTIEDYTIGDFGYLVMGREEIERENRGLRAQVERAREVEGWLTGLGSSWVMFITGERVEVGQTIRTTEHAGKKLVAVNFTGRYALLSDSSVVSLRVPDGTKTGGLGSFVSGGPSGTGGTPGGTARGGEDRGPRDGGGGGNDAGRVPANAQPGNG